MPSELCNVQNNLIATARGDWVFNLPAPPLMKVPGLLVNGVDTFVLFCFWPNSGCHGAQTADLVVAAVPAAERGNIENHLRKGRGIEVHGFPNYKGEIPHLYWKEVP